MPFINIDDYDPIELAPGARARTPYGKNVMLSYLELDEGSMQSSSTSTCAKTELPSPSP